MRFHPFPVLAGIWSMGVIGIIVNLLSTRIENQENFLGLYAPWISVGALTLAGATLWAWFDYRHRQASSYFDILKEATKLCSDDFFPPVRRRREKDLTYRPYHQIYIPRKAIPYDHISEAHPPYVYGEQELVQSLQRGEGFLLIGQPLEGKTRTLFTVVQQMAGYLVVKPTRTRPLPPDDALAALKNRQVILFVDDLIDYVGNQLDLHEFSEKLRRYAGLMVVAATCRDGPELGTVKQVVGMGLRRFFEDIPLKLKLDPLTLEEKKALAEGIGKPWKPEHTALFPTPGSIVMEESLKMMDLRFQALSPELQDVLRALKLLTAAGILPHTSVRLDAVLRRIFKRSLHIGDCLSALADQSFVRKRGQPEPIEPEPVYLSIVPYSRHDNRPHNDFPELITVMESIEDVEGLRFLGRKLFESHDVAIVKQCFEKAALLQPNLPLILLDESVSMLATNHFEDAVLACDSILLLEPNDVAAWHIKGASLSALGRDEEARAAYERTLALTSEDWKYKGSILAALGRHQEALTAYERTLTLSSYEPQTWKNKGDSLAALGRHEEALTAYDHSLAITPDEPQTWKNKGDSLAAVGRDEEACAAYERALALTPDYPSAWRDKGSILAALGRHEEALTAYDHSLAITPDDFVVWGHKGNSLAALGRHEEALTAYDHSQALTTENPTTWQNKGTILAVLGRHGEALTAYEHALALEPDDPKTWSKKGNSLAVLGRHGEALTAYERALELNPHLLMAWYRMANLLEALGRYTDAEKSRLRALQLLREETDC
ncbi:MAG: tetratricopeptide repeat protein [Deltaproteobacteria bacterium]|nr:tetratricopeptide repeat protein [Deltaproteobacteria bacterium]